MCRVSLIMTTFNSMDHIDMTLESAMSQDYPDLEIVIADGGSTDGTVDVIRRYAKLSETADNISIIWNSEQDKGIYDGMNKAIRRSSGDIVAVFNDLFTRKDAVSAMVSAIQDGNHIWGDQFCIGAHADLAYVDEKGKTIREWVMGNGTIEQGWLPAHPTLYLKRRVYEAYGLYDISFSSSSDYEFMVRVLKQSENKLAYLHEEIIHMYYGGTSNGGVLGYLINVKEAYGALRKNEVSGAAMIIFRRILRTLQQFHAR